MRTASLAAIFLVVAIAPFIACVGDAPVDDDASTLDSATDTSTPDVGTPDVTQPNDGGADAPIDSGVDATKACSNATVGNSIPIPTGTFNVSFLQQSGPLLGGTYPMKSISVKGSFCAPPCPEPQGGGIIGGLAITDLGSGNYDIERHIELQQGAVKTTRIDRFGGSFDQINQRVNVTRECSIDGGADDAGVQWSLIVILGDGGVPTGSINVEIPDVPTALVYPDGGAGGTGATYGFFTKQ